MAEQRPVEGNEEKIIDIERKDGLLEELNLPPHMIKFIRENSRNLQIATACLVVLVLGWIYYDYYSQTREDRASAALNAVAREVDDPARIELLQNVAAEFPRTAAAMWSRIEQGHIAFADGDYDKALAIYTDVADALDSDSPLLPLLTYNIGLGRENGGEPDRALEAYADLAAYDGFAVKGLMAQGRIYELKGENDQALRVYRKAGEKELLSELDRSILNEKINTLQPPGSAPESS